MTTDLRAALAQSDVVCTATTAHEPVFADRDIRPGTHINAIGAFTPEMHEIPPETVARARVVVDAVDAVLAEAGDLIAPIAAGLVPRDHVTTELGQVVAGNAAGRPGDEAVTLFKSVGNAVQDIIVARQALTEAERQSRGQRITL